ncbi:hypothetical protein [Dendronalium phyllosphericum]|uniref:hypothetical protein n=1 Tax=Dendronalium phyllosphericum TaxID=2840445 RepID=UPI00298F3046|nr:hypothetical protein [Dendronalium phyllosphericum]
MSLIDKLTPEQEALIPVYREKWRKVALSTERINHKQATEAVKSGYAAIRKQEPEIIFCDSPYAGLKIVIQRQLKQQSNTELYNLLCECTNELRCQIAYQLESQVMSQIVTVAQLDFTILEDILRSELKPQLTLQKNLRSSWFKAQLYSGAFGLLDFYVSVLNCFYNQMK